MARKKGPQVQQAYEFLKQKILSFELAPGTAVSDSQYSQELGISRSPIREAIMRLVADGLIEEIDKKTVVAKMTLDDIIEICQVRDVVEVAAIRLIKENGGLNPEQKQELARIFSSMKNAKDLVDDYYYDDLFHNMIMGFASNRRLREISERMRLQIARARWLNLVLPERRSEALNEHEAIFDALMSGNCEEAEASMRRHLANSAENFKKVLNSPQYSPQFSLAMASFTRGKSV